MNMETSSLAYVFDAPHSSDDDMYPLIEDHHEAAPLSPDDQALLMGMYPATMSDLDFVATVQALPHHHEPDQQQHHQHQQHYHGHHHSALPDKTSHAHDLDISADHHHAGAASATAVFHELQTPFFSNGAAHSPPPAPSPRKNERAKQQQRPAQRTRSRTSSPVASPTMSVNGSDSGFRDSEEILNAPVKSLTEEEKKLRRRAQVAKSARKHRNRQKEELARLREQVLLLQEQMAKMMHHSGTESAERIKQEQEVITHHRKRKKVDDDDDLFDSEDGALIATQSQLAALSTNALDLDFSVAPQTKIQHWFHHLPVDTLQRSKMLHHIAAKRMDLALQYVHSEFGPGPVSYPLTDIKLNSNGPDIEIKLLRAKQVPGFTHQELGEACWNSIFNFQFDIPERFQPHVKCERLMELDENTRYGRTIAPLLKDYEENRIVYFHSYFLVHRRVLDQFVLIMWETIHMDDLYPPAADESPDFTLRNDEVGWCVPVCLMVAKCIILAQCLTNLLVL